MGTDTPQPRGTKEWLVEDGLRVLTTKHRRELARDLLLGGTALPRRWLTPEQRTFIALDLSKPLNDGTRKAGAELVDRVIHLCDQVIPRIVDDNLRRRALDQDARRALRRRAPVLVRDALLRSCPTWPSADIDGLAPRVRSAVEKALAHGQAQQAPAAGDYGLVLRPDERPVDRRDYDEKLSTRATSEEALYGRYHRFLWGQEARRAAGVAVALVAAASMAILYLVLFAVLRYVEPTLSVRDAIVVDGAAFGAALGGTGIGLLGPAITARWGRGRPGSEPPATRSGREDPARPESR